MNPDVRFQIIIAALAGIGLPLLIMAFRGMMKWTRVEVTLENLVNDVRKLVEDKDRVHQSIIESQRDDRQATDKRLRWLEENLYQRGRRPNG